MDTKNFLRIYITRSEFESNIQSITFLKKTKIKRDHKLINLLKNSVKYNDQIVKVIETESSITKVQLVGGKIIEVFTKHLSGLRIPQIKEIKKRDYPWEHSRPEFMSALLG